MLGCFQQWWKWNPWIGMGMDETCRAVSLVVGGLKWVVANAEHFLFAAIISATTVIISSKLLLFPSSSITSTISSAAAFVPLLLPPYWGHCYCHLPYHKYISCVTATISVINTNSYATANISSHLKYSLLPFCCHFTLTLKWIWSGTSFMHTCSQWLDTWGH